MQASRKSDPTIKLWHFNRHAAQWERIKQCRPDTADLWLTLYKLEQPGEHYRLAQRRPYVPPEDNHSNTSH